MEFSSLVWETKPSLLLGEQIDVKGRAETLTGEAAFDSADLAFVFRSKNDATPQKC